ncbi:hypothetical protein YTPLAS18_40510 [Nitrospira sp.]|nr:hypothetical protein YTPLAS18_40510 [Nitrospira sp.]
MECAIAVLARGWGRPGGGGLGSLTFRGVIEEDGVRHLGGRGTVSRTTLVYYFGNRIGLLGAVAAEGFRRLEHGLDSVSGRGGLKTLRALGGTYLDFGLGNPALFHAMYAPEVWTSLKNGDWSAPTAMQWLTLAESERDACFGHFRAAVMDAQSDGSLRKGAPEHLARTVTALVDGLLFQALIENVKDRVSEERLAAELGRSLDYIIEGLRA